MPTFNNPEQKKKRPFENKVEKGENSGNQHFLTMFSTLSNTKFNP